MIVTIFKSDLEWIKYLTEFSPLINLDRRIICIEITISHIVIVRFMHVSRMLDNNFQRYRQEILKELSFK